MYLYLYFTMYFTRDDNVNTEPRSINQGAPFVPTLLGGASSLPRGRLPPHQGQGHWPSAQQMGPRLGDHGRPRAPRMENPVDLGPGTLERLDLDRQIQYPLDPWIAQLADDNDPWLRPMEENLGSYQIPGIVPQPPKGQFLKGLLELK